MQSTILKYLCLAITLSHATTSAGQSSSDFSLPPPSAEAGEQLQLWATHYFVHAAPSTPTGIPFQDKTGTALSDKVSPRDWCLAAIEGTVQVDFNGEPRTLNYGGIGSKNNVDCAAVLRIDPLKKPWITRTGKSFFTKANGIYGDGITGYQLIPFRTIAVDRKTLPYGSVIYIPTARGIEIQLPTGLTAKHDGYFFAGDTGGAIKGQHIDVFCGTSSKNCLPGFVRSDKNITFSAIMISDKEIVKQLTDQHKK
ncbi:3D domain-containing protein [Sphaerotilus uruguayifluvii]|uniref:3D (Asp-Asp-Asp) domain-containing protein n=1 Tax=Sphaerotilus uruguayifluvii TaxID=2735897 RepID=A0ABX2G2E8_9BURK|nr:3D domain-containing protein [Leptothrix sp. C29]NRT56449.1 3D (Asp-Asp-Asp) domain-containing protein [Leptothrix sp. C29]